MHSFHIWQTVMVSESYVVKTLDGNQVNDVGRQVPVRIGDGVENGNNAGLWIDTFMVFSYL